MLVGHLLIERRHILHLVLSGDLLGLRCVSVHKLCIRLHIRRRRLELHAGHMQRGPVPLWIELLRLLARLCIDGRHSHLVQHVPRKHLCGLVCGLLHRLRNRYELEQWRLELFSNPVRKRPAARGQHLHNMRRWLVFFRWFLIVLRVPGEHLLGCWRLFVPLMSCRSVVYRRHLILHGRHLPGWADCFG